MIWDKETNTTFKVFLQRGYMSDGLSLKTQEMTLGPIH